MGIDSKHPDYQANIDIWTQNRDFYNGEIPVKEAGQTYLPSDHNKKIYNVYRQRAYFFPATARTVEALSGLATRKPSVITLPGEMTTAPFMPDGMTQEVLEQVTVKELLMTGRFAYLIDKDAAESTDSVKINLYTAEQITNWRYTNSVLDLVVLNEMVFEPNFDDPYKLDQIEQYRELYLEEGIYKQRVWRKASNATVINQWAIYQDEMIPSIRGESLDYIPIVIMNSTTAGTRVEKAPLSDLVVTNKYHYQTSADYSYILRKMATPTLVRTGVAKKDNVPVALGGVMDIQNKDAKVEFVEVQGTGVTFIKDQLAVFSAQMATLGSKLLDNTRMNETAETVMLHQGSENASLLSVVNSLESGMRTALRYIMDWETTSLNEGDVDYQVSKDLISIKMQAGELSALLTSYLAGAISHDTFLKNLVEGEILKSSVDEEKNQIELETTEKELSALIAVRPESDEQDIEK